MNLRKQEEDEKAKEAVWKDIKNSQVFLPAICSRNAKDRQNSTRLVIMSDTHGKHHDVKLPPGDVLVHAGDFTGNGQLNDIRSLSSYFERAAKKYSQIVCIAGNHELTFQPEFYDKHWQEFHKEKVDPVECRTALRNCTYLEDATTIIEKGNLHVYGSPWTPYFCGWAFNLDRGADILKKWQDIPNSTDVLITHGPPLGRCDRAMVRDSRCNGGSSQPLRRTGCYDLLQEVQTRIRPRLHIFGHIHEDYGASYDGNTLYVNAANVDHDYRPRNPCFVVDVPHDKLKPAVVVSPTCNVQNTDLRRWFEDHDYTLLASRMAEVDDVQSLPSGNALLQKDAPEKLFVAMLLYRDRSACQMLFDALSDMYVESFEQ